MIRRYGPPPESGYRYRHRAGVYAILWRDGRILLTYQDHPEYEFQLPGGGVDPGEAPLAALHREVREETGWRIAPLRRLGTFRRFAFLPEYELRAEKLCTVYLARPVRPLGPPAEAGHSSHWFDPQAALQILPNEGDRDFLRLVLRAGRR